MNLLEFMEYTKLNTVSECSRAKLLCFYHYKESGEDLFTMQMVTSLLIKSGFNAPNTSRLRDKLTKGKDKIFLIVKGSKTEYSFIPIILQNMEKEYNNLWIDTETIESASELIDETKFCGKRKYLNKLIMQINHCYSNNCFDACAVLMRRLFEVLLVLSYQNLSIDSEIKDSTGSGYVLLDGIVKNAKENSVLKLSRIKIEFDTFRKVGNFSAHNITYTAGKKDIDDIKLNYRVMLEELYNKAGLI